MQDDYYALLGILDTANNTEIKKGYRDKARILHPDKNDAPNAKEVFCKIKKAYDVLSSPDEKKKYDSQRATSRILFNINNLANNPGQSSSPFHNVNVVFPRKKTPSTMRKDRNWEEIRAMSKGGQYYREYLERMRRQRREQMNRRHFETFHQPRYFEMQQDHRDAAVKYARLKLEWSFDTDISISMLKERILADSIFSTGSGTEKSAVASFKNGQDALTASQILATHLSNVTYTWLTPKPTYDSKDTSPIVLEDSDEDIVVIEDFEDDDCYVTTSTFGGNRHDEEHVEIIDSDNDSDNDSDIIIDDIIIDDMVIDDDDDIVIDEEIIIDENGPMPTQPSSNRGSSVSPDLTNSPEGVILID